MSLMEEKRARIPNHSIILVLLRKTKSLKMERKGLGRTIALYLITRPYSQAPSCLVRLLLQISIESDLADSA